MARSAASSGSASVSRAGDEARVGGAVPGAATRPDRASTGRAGRSPGRARRRTTRALRPLPGVWKSYGHRAILRASISPCIAATWSPSWGRVLGQEHAPADDRASGADGPGRSRWTDIHRYERVNGGALRPSRHVARERARARIGWSSAVSTCSHLPRRQHLRARARARDARRCAGAGHHAVSSSPGATTPTTCPRDSRASNSAAIARRCHLTRSSLDSHVARPLAGLRGASVIPPRGGHDHDLVTHELRFAAVPIASYHGDAASSRSTPKRSGAPPQARHSSSSTCQTISV